MTPKRVSSLKLPSGVEWTGLRRTVIHPVTDAHSGKPRDALSRASNHRDAEASDLAIESDGTDSDMPVLEPLVVPDAQSARAVLAELQARPKSEDQPAVFMQGEQGHKRRTQQQCESTLPKQTGLPNRGPAPGRKRSRNF